MSRDYQARSDVHAYGTAWVLLCVAVGIHVIDEAANNFLSLYNPTVLALRNRIPWLPLPTFTIREWITGLAVAIALGLLLSPFAFRGALWLRPLAYFLAVSMMANGLQHMVASVYLHRLAPGVYSSPLLIVTAVNLFLVLLRSRSTPSATADSEG